MAQYDFMIAGRWRNKEAVQEVLDAVRAAGKTAYCFLENAYKGDKVEFHRNDDIEATMQSMEALNQDDPFVRRVFETDIQAERDAESLVLVLPAGISGHIEAGIAYGLGKPCYAVGPLEKTETLYCVFDKIFPTPSEFIKYVEGQ
ncbi:hypothetical protein TM7_0185 [candidate division TM7 genomosp. GTL1]|nr:hypothetical protein TM7_0185 [candidate division TM7 genomosp. GTL1]